MKQKQYPYQNPELPVEQRVFDLLGRMSIAEKIRQLGCTQAFGNPQPPEELDLQNGIGEVALMGGEPETTARFIRNYQEYIIEHSPHGVPALFHMECLSGPLMSGSNLFPTSISLSASFDPEIVRDMCERNRKQMVSVGIRHALSPVLDVARDLRWGRVNETYGGDPVLSSVMGCAFVESMQGDLVNGVAATAKHFLGYSQTEGGMNMSRTLTDPRELRETFARPFEAAIQKSHICSVMNSYSEWNGKPICASKEILNDLLRDDLGFQGVVVSDYKSVPRLVKVYHTADNITEAAKQCLLAGLDVELPYRLGYSDDLIRAVEEGEFDISCVDSSVSRILTLKFQLGLFENPYPHEQEIPSAFAPEENSRKSLEAAQKVMTLTKNDHLLPLTDKNKSIAVIGPAGNCMRLFFGSYTYPAMIESRELVMAGVDTEPIPVLDSDCTDRITSKASSWLVKNSDKHLLDGKLRAIYPGIKTIFEALAEEDYTSVTYTEGCDYNGSECDIPAAVKAAEKSDYVILTLGGKNGWGWHSTTGEGIDSTSTDLPGMQETLMRAVYEVNQNTVIVHMDGRPLVSQWAYDHIPAILEAWLPCTYGGIAIAKTISGANNPAGRVPLDIPRGTGNMPVYHNMQKGSGPLTFKNDALYTYGYIDSLNTALIPFGYGLSYTTFGYENFYLKTFENGETTAQISVKNNGNVTGDEVVQLYGRDDYATMIRPEQELIGFKRITLEPGETKTIVFHFNLNQLSFIDEHGKWILEKGTFTYFVGGNSREFAAQAQYSLPHTRQIEHSRRCFFATAEVL